MFSNADYHKRPLSWKEISTTHYSANFAHVLAFCSQTSSCLEFWKHVFNIYLHSLSFIDLWYNMIYDVSRLRSWSPSWAMAARWCYARAPLRHIRCLLGRATSVWAAFLRWAEPADVRAGSSWRRFQVGLLLELGLEMVWNRCLIFQVKTRRTHENKCTIMHLFESCVIQIEWTSCFRCLLDLKPSPCHHMHRRQGHWLAFPGLCHRRPLPEDCGFWWRADGAASQKTFILIHVQSLQLGTSKYHRDLAAYKLLSAPARNAACTSILRDSAKKQTFLDLFGFRKCFAQDQSGSSLGRGGVCTVQRGTHQTQVTVLAPKAWNSMSFLDLYKPTKMFKSCCCAWSCNKIIHNFIL